uniref:Calmodulin n=1 Tax=Rhipicephalus appendiculatus TaxID=34631 RepID=A0A131YPV2_RHIAP
MAAKSHERLSPTNVTAGTEAPGSLGQLTASLSGEWAAGLSDFSASAPDAKLGKGSSSNLDDRKTGKSSKTLSAEQLADVEKSEAMKDTLTMACKLNATLSAEQVADVVHDVSKKAALAMVDKLNLLGSLGSSALEKEAALDTDKLNAKMSGSKAEDSENDGSKKQGQAEKAEPRPVSELNANLSDDRVAEIKRVFEDYDTEGSGAIPVSKLGTVMRSLGYKLTESNLQDILGPVKRTVITFSELITMIAKDVLAANAEEEFKQVFKVFDHNGDGLVSCAELRYAMTTLGQKLSSEDVDEMIRGIKKDVKGKVTFDEFVTMVTSK